MNDDAMMRERLSALADGQLDDEEFAHAVAWAGTQEGQSCWRLYHVVGEAMRGEPHAHAAPDASLLERLREQLAREPQRAPAQIVQIAPAALPGAGDVAANASAWRWKIAAGCASLVAVAALGWDVYAGLAPGAVAPAAQAQLAAVQPAAPIAQEPSALVAAEGGSGEQVMIRDQRLDELLAAHRRFGSASDLGFLRNATFESDETAP